MRHLPVTFAAAVVLSLSAAPAPGGPSNSLMDISADGALLACSNRDSGTVTIVDLASHTKRHEVKVGHKPEGVSFIGATHRLAVALYQDDEVALVDGEAGKVVGRVPVYDEPYAVVSDKAGRWLFVTLSYPGQVVQIDPGEMAVTRTMSAGSFARGLALTPDESTLLVTEYYTSLVIALDVKTGKRVDQWAGASTDNLARQIVVSPRRAKAYVPHMRSRVAAAHGEGSIFPYVSVIDAPRGDTEGKGRKRIPMDAFVGNRVTANPWEVAVSPDGRRLFVVFGGTNDLYACEVIDDDYRELGYRGTLQLGANPRAVRVSPDGNLFYVYNALDFNVVAYDAKTLRKRHEVVVTANPLGDEVLLGKKLFYSALQPMVGRRWISCSSCHPDGESDRRTWQNPEGLRDTPSLGGLARTHPLHWSADRDESQDFEITIRSQLMQGRGLIKGKVNPGLGKPNAGLSRELDALAAYTNSHGLTLSPYAKGGLSDAAKRGRTLFHSKETGCATCHSGPYYTDSVTGRPIVTHDVGTGGDDPSEKMGPAYDTPTLLGVYRTAPYLHHGKAATLKEVLTTRNKGDKHGKTSHLSEAQLDDLVAFLKSLPFEEPGP